jgi:hypothetical protein
LDAHEKNHRRNSRYGGDMNMEAPGIEKRAETPELHAIRSNMRLLGQIGRHAEKADPEPFGDMKGVMATDSGPLRRPRARPQRRLPIRVEGGALAYEYSFVVAPPGGFEEERIAHGLDLLLGDRPSP